MHAWLGLGHSGHACLPALPCPAHCIARAAFTCMHAKDHGRMLQPGSTDGCMQVCVYTAVKRGAGANDSGGRMHAGMA
jgi:hypothetical protein